VRRSLTQKLPAGARRGRSPLLIFIILISKSLLFLLRKGLKEEEEFAERGRV
jgi:hypothetical protein